LIADSLSVQSRAVAVATNERILDHLALDALQILELISDCPAVHQLNQAPLNHALVNDVLAVLALPLAAHSAAPLARLLIDKWISADVNVDCDLAVLADHVGEHQHQTWLVALHHVGGELLLVNQLQEVLLQGCGLQRKGIVQGEDVVADLL
jgi:hypothetical protein